MVVREEYWNIGYPLFGSLVSVAAGLVLAMAAYALWRRVRIWRLGASVDDLVPWGDRIKMFAGYLLNDVLLHRKLIRHEHYPGVMHLLIFWGFLILLVATVLTGLEFYLGRYVGWTLPTVRYSAQTGLVWDVGGVLATVGLLMAAYRRYVIRPTRIPTKFNAGVVLGVLLLLIITGYLVEGLRIGATELNSSSVLYNPGESGWSPVGWGVAKAMIRLGVTPAAMETIHVILWWVHAAVFLGGFGYMAVRFGRLAHIAISPLHIFLRTRELPVHDENADGLGVKKIADLPDMTWRQLLSLDACTNCGRCEDWCPVRADGSALSPRRVVQHMKRFMLERAPVLLGTPADEVPAVPSPTALESIGDEQALMSCTMCAACVEICPVSIDQMALIAGVRVGLDSRS